MDNISLELFPIYQIRFENVWIRENITKFYCIYPQNCNLKWNKHFCSSSWRKPGIDLHDYVSIQTFYLFSTAKRNDQRECFILENTTGNNFAFSNSKDIPKKFAKFSDIGKRFDMELTLRGTFIISTSVTFKLPRHLNNLR